MTMLAGYFPELRRFYIRATKEVTFHELESLEGMGYKLSFNHEAALLSKDRGRL